MFHKRSLASLSSNPETGAVHMTLIFERNKYPLLFVALCLVTRSCQTHCDPVNCSPPESSIHGDSPDKNTGVSCHASSRESSKPRSSASQASSLPSESPRKLYCTGICKPTFVAILYTLLNNQNSKKKKNWKKKSRLEHWSNLKHSFIMVTFCKGSFYMINLFKSGSKQRK